MEILSPYELATSDGYKYFFTIADDFLRVKLKSDASVVNSFLLMYKLKVMCMSLYEIILEYLIRCSSNVFMNYILTLYIYKNHYDVRRSLFDQPYFPTQCALFEK